MPVKAEGQSKVRKDGWEAIITVSAPHHPGLEATFTYRMEGPDFNDLLGRPVLVGYAIGRRDAAVLPIPPAVQVNLPHWEREAERQAAELWVGDWERVNGGPEALRRALAAIARQRSDELPEPSPALGRPRSGARLSPTPLLVDVVAEYQRLMDEGVPNPAVALAERRGVAYSTVRGWMLRARRAGLLPPT